MKLTTDILPRALWNFCEEIFRIKNTRLILLKTLKFLMAFAIEQKTTTKRKCWQILKVGFSRCEKALLVGNFEYLFRSITTIMNYSSEPLLLLEPP